MIFFSLISPLRVSEEMFKEMGLGGVWVNNIESDDPSDECGWGKFPQTKAFMVGVRGENYCALPKCL